MRTLARIRLSSKMAHDDLICRHQFPPRSSGTPLRMRRTCFDERIWLPSSDATGPSPSAGGCFVPEFGSFVRGGQIAAMGAANLSNFSRLTVPARRHVSALAARRAFGLAHATMVDHPTRFGIYSKPSSWARLVAIRNWLCCNLAAGMRRSPRRRTSEWNLLRAEPFLFPSHNQRRRSWTRNTSKARPIRRRALSKTRSAR